jgi:hypothetical protein
MFGGGCRECLCFWNWDFGGRDSDENCMEFGALSYLFEIYI